MSETREDVDLRVQSDEGFNESKQINADPNIESSSKTNINQNSSAKQYSGQKKSNGEQKDTLSKLDGQSQQKNFAEARRKTLQQRKSISSINNGLRVKNTDGELKTEENQKATPGAPTAADEENKDKTKFQVFKEKLDFALEHNATTIVMTIITLYALFGDDIRILVTNASGDPVFWVFNIIAMFAFTVEILISSIVKKDYWLGFFFWLDVISTLSLVLDIGWVNQEIFQSGSSGAESAASLARAGRASRVGTKAGRIVRIVRLIRLVKLYKHAQQAFAKEIEDELSIEQEFQQQEQNEKNNQMNQQFEKRSKKKKKVGKHRKSQENHEDKSQHSGEQLNEGEGENGEAPANGEGVEGDENSQLVPQNKNKIKLPPLENNSKVHDDGENNEVEPDGPSKPQPLDQYKDDPLIKKQTEEEDDKKQILKQSDADLVEQTPIKNSESDENLKSKKASTIEINSNVNNEVEPTAEQQEKKQESSHQIENNSQKNDNKIATGQTIDPEKEQLNTNTGEAKQPSITLSKKQLQEEEERKRQEEQKKIDEQKVSEDEIPQETIVGKKLSDLTTKRVITLVMSIMFSVPLFTVDTYQEQTVSYDNGLKNILAFKDNEKLMEIAIEEYVKFHEDQRAPVIFIEFYNVEWDCCKKYPKNEADRLSKGIEDWEELRNDEITYYIVEDDNDELLASSITNNQTDYILNAILSLIRTVFVSVILGGGALLFSKDVQELVLDPIKNMLEKIVKIAKNPLEAAQIEQTQALAWEMMRKKGLTKELDKKKEEEKMETAILEKLIIKIGALLALGFGEAGSEIIAQNMQKTGEVDPFIPGKKMMGIFGFCNIQHFQDSTEVLQSNIMVFVNEIAEITHGIVDKYSGQSNKNIGEAFLVVWGFDESFYTVDSNGKFKLGDKPYINEYSDLSVIAFLKIQAAIYMNKKLSKYNDDPEFQKRIQNYRVKMGFGLHVGWAIEGAIGSTFKIDASYLSPHVNMASRLEYATKQFGTSLLISEDLYNIMSSGSQYYCRKIDRVTVKGSKTPVDLYTVDVQVENIDNYTQLVDEYNKKENNKLTMDQKKKKRVLQKLWRKNFIQQLQDGKEQSCNLFLKDRDLQVIQEIFSEDFPELWEEGFDAYIDGDWEKAADIFNQTKVMLQEDGYIDGPSQTLLNYMAQYENQAPETWKNYRELTEK